MNEPQHRHVAAYEPLKEGLAKLTGKNPPGAKYTKKAPVMVPAEALKVLCDRHTREWVCKAIDVSQSHLSALLSSGEAPKKYEYAAKWILHRETVNSQIKDLTPQECINGLLAYFSRLSVFDLTPEMTELLRRPLGETLQELGERRSAARAGATAPKALGR